ncbi:2-amino-4-hydroxy-6-hydroxymethyldihydropteridinediphosphokinase [Dyella sp. OK004]|uniref:2-amino-4-hydroxy-6- hydroxymethyldihydropteridine diphosphokinase n=1 Tax=Dyella sp. OK004 TaxID=1855292 RepID=UPI0008E54CF3|nr:2-amino-4-hydroxy-6-hydroxymethyldihydropteridine diphosphokinase [Dyella sp. OK004]SFS01322.1 2-amino-4-hydroxy-6-hydroxymethyldihydropteridinediphosphokinase [Dyella sp. OK004]
MTTAYIALGSNLGDSRQYLRDAIEALARLPDTQVMACSRFYRTPPWGVLEQPPFINAAVQIDTAMNADALLQSLLAIERAAGRVRDGERWGPRTLDLDLLHMEGVQWRDAQLTLPHPRIAERAFVLLPLHDLAPDLTIPGQGRVTELLAALDHSECETLP